VLPLYIACASRLLDALRSLRFAGIGMAMVRAVVDDDFQVLADFFRNAPTTSGSLRS
jgi:hypothetical protein